MSGYWKYKGAQQKMEADKYDNRIIKMMEGAGWRKIREATKREDQVEKWDYLFVNPDGVEHRVDFKTGCGVQDSHRKGIENDTLRCTMYAHFNPRAGKLKLRPVESFWNHPDLQRRTNRHNQVYWCTCTHH